MAAAKLQSQNLLKGLQTNPVAMPDLSELSARAQQQLKDLIAGYAKP